MNLLNHFTHVFCDACNDDVQLRVVNEPDGSGTVTCPECDSVLLMLGNHPERNGDTR